MLVRMDSYCVVVLPRDYLRYYLKSLKSTCTSSCTESLLHESILKNLAYKLQLLNLQTSYSWQKNAMKFLLTTKQTTKLYKRLNKYK